MKKTCNRIWLLKPDANFHKLLLTLKILVLLLFCGLALPAISLASKNRPVKSFREMVEQQAMKVSGTITDESNSPLPGVNVQLKEQLSVPLQT